MVSSRARVIGCARSETPWRLPESIDFRRAPSALRWERHLYVESDGHFRAELGGWEAVVLAEKLARADVVAWLRNVDRKPWSLEIPYETGGEIRPPVSRSADRASGRR